MGSRYSIIVKRVEFSVEQEKKKKMTGAGHGGSLYILYIYGDPPMSRMSQRRRPETSGPFSDV